MQLFKLTILVFLIIAVLVLLSTILLLVTKHGNPRIIGIYCFLSFLITLSFSAIYFIVLRLYQ